MKLLNAIELTKIVHEQRKGLALRIASRSLPVEATAEHIIARANRIVDNKQMTLSKMRELVPDD